MEAFVERSQQTRMDILRAACERDCVCGGRWLPMASELFVKNGLDQDGWVRAVLYSLKNGRHKGHLLCHAGHKGNEGKSFLLEPLEALFGEEAVFTSPPKGGFPLLGLERCRAALLDDWRFNEDIISYNLQLLWFEGKPIVIARPQNHFSGHLRYNGDSPIFITTLLSDITSLKGKKLQGGDVEMMLRRLKIFEFSHKLEQPMRIPACARCFARLLLGCPGDVGGAPVAPGTSSGSNEQAEQRRAKAPRVGWTVQEVGDWLGELGLGHLANVFELNAVDGHFLSELSQDDLMKELGCTNLQARKILRHTSA